MVEANPQPQIKHTRKQLTDASRAFSQVLRHGAENKGIAIRPDGFILLDDLLAVRKIEKMRIGRPEVEWIVNNNDKKRFELREEDGKMYIRATQGHSMQSVQTEDLLEQI